MKWLNGIQTPSSPLFYFFSTLSELGKDKTRHVTSNAIQEVQWLSRLSKHIYFHGKDLFINL